jgi:hypothetical protein
LAALKGRGFSHATGWVNEVLGFSPRGNLFSIACIPSAAKAGSVFGPLGGTSKAVPFQRSEFFRSLFSRAGRATKSCRALAPAFLLSVTCNFAAAKAGIKMGPLAARLKSCPDAYRSLKVILHEAITTDLPALPRDPVLSEIEQCHTGSGHLENAAFRPAQTNIFIFNAH